MCIHIYIYIYIYVCVCVCVCICLYIYIYIYICIVTMLNSVAGRFHIFSNVESFSISLPLEPADIDETAGS